MTEMSDETVSASYHLQEVTKLDAEIARLRNGHDALANWQRNALKDIERLERKAKERDELYWHCKELVELLCNMRFQPVATYAAAYLTRVVPPEDKLEDKPDDGGVDK
jgi:hypothetical protein